jgi:hypothetical protein
LAPSFARFFLSFTRILKLTIIWLVFQRYEQFITITNGKKEFQKAIGKFIATIPFLRTCRKRLSATPFFHATEEKNRNSLKPLLSKS